MVKCEICKIKANIVAGKCSYCEKIYCYLHRYQETHSCDKLKNHIDDTICKLSTKLIQESLKDSKINSI